jgi:hypothetical protein
MNRPDTGESLPTADVLSWLCGRDPRLTGLRVHSLIGGGGSAYVFQYRAAVFA